MFLRYVTASLALSALLVALAAAAGSSPAAAQRCTSSGEAWLHVNARYNASGHWLAEVRLEREAPRPSRPTTLLLDVRPTSTRCKGHNVYALSVTLQGPAPPAGPGYTEAEGGEGVHRVHPEKLSWEEARAACEAEDAHLLVLNSEAEAAAVQRLLRQHPSITDWVHVGFHDKQAEGQYVTVFGEPLSSTGFTRWLAGQPDNAGNNEDCGSIHVSSMGLNDIPCTTHKAPFVCEQS